MIQDLHVDERPTQAPLGDLGLGVVAELHPLLGPRLEAVEVLVADQLPEKLP